MTTFKELGLNSEIMKGLKDLGFETPTPIQEKVIPFILKSNKDLIALAQTGTGKTAAFSLPILNQIKTNERELQAIIICPTRELCLQISEDIKNLAKYSKGFSVTPVYGGARIDIQIRSIKKGTNIVVGTPGRLHDLIRRKVLKLRSIRWMVLDEADEMLDMGFKDDLDAILEQTPQTKQTLLFSATISKSVHNIAKQYMKESEEISIGQKNVGSDNVTHEYYTVQARDRFEALKRILDSLPGVYGILFCRTKQETQEISDKLNRSNYETEALHGDVSQSMRTQIMSRFKNKRSGLLVATDVAARGIDVSDLSHVINYNLPDTDEGYTHRSGRTGRAHKKGVSIVIIGPREIRKIREIENIIGKKFEHKRVPSQEEICQKQLDIFLKEIENTDIKNIGNEKYFEEITTNLQKITKDDLIKLFLAHKFKDLIAAYKNSGDLNAEVRDIKERKKGGDTTSLKINFGKKNGFDVKALFFLINSNKKIKGVEIGRINLMPNYSIFAVDRNSANDVIRYLSGTSFRGENVSIQKSDEEVIERSPRKRRGGSNRNFRGRKNGFRR